MIALLQRVSQASVRIDGQSVAAIDHGLLIFLCAEHGDSEALADKLLAKILKLRVFSDLGGKMNRSVQDVSGALLVVSQFTLAADLSGGNRPSFTGAASPAEGKRLYDHFLQQARRAHPAVESGRFGADMQVALINDGPVTVPVVVRSPP